MYIRLAVPYPHGFDTLLSFISSCVCCGVAQDNMALGFANHAAMQDFIGADLGQYTIRPSQGQDSSDLTAANFERIVYNPKCTVAVFFFDSYQSTNRSPSPSACSSLLYLHLFNCLFLRRYS